MIPPPLMLDHHQAEELRHLLGTIEDWLLRCCDEATDDLGRFLTDLGWNPGPPQRLVTMLITELGEHGQTLRRPTSPSYGRGQEDRHE